jgi:hypothetical protein
MGENVNLSNISGETREQEKNERCLAQEMDSHYAQLFAASVNVSADKTASSTNAPLLDDVSVETLSDATRKTRRMLLPANRFQRAALFAATACTALGCCAFFVGSWPAYSSSDSPMVSRSTGRAAEPEYSSPDSGVEPMPAPSTPTDSAAAANNDADAQSGDNSGVKNLRQKSTASAPSAPARAAATAARSTSAASLERPSRPALLPSVTAVSTPAQIAPVAAQPAAQTPADAGASTGEATVPQMASSRATSSPVIRSSAQSNPQLRGGVSTGGRPLAPGGNGGYVSLRRSSGDSDYEEKRLTQAIDAGGNNGRDLAGLYQQRALLFLNQGDNDRAIPDFQKAIELYSSMIQGHDRVKEAQDGLQSSKNGLKIASKTQVF